MTDVTIQLPTDEPVGFLAGISPVIALQLQRLVAEAVEPLVEEIASLKAEVDRLKSTSPPPVDIASGEVVLPQQVPTPPESVLLEEISQLRDDMEAMNEHRALEIATDRRRIAALEMPTPQPKQRTQGDLLRILLASTHNGKMLQKQAREKMGISKSAFSRLLQTLRGSVKMEPYHMDRRQNVLVLINKES